MKDTLFICLIGVFIFFGCESVENWKIETDSIAPGPVTNETYEGIPGGAIITYDVPTDSDLLGVKAIYSNDKDELCEVFSSAHRDTIILAGFGDTEVRMVELVAVDEGLNESAAKQISITPDTPPAILVQESLNVSPAFGGLYVNWINPIGSAVGIELWKKNELNELEYVETHYTDDEGENGYSFRGQEALETEFMLLVRDRWDNYSDSVNKVLTPLFEEEIVGKDVFERWGYDDKSCVYRGEIPTVAQSSKGFFRLWDGVTISRNDYFHTGDAGNQLGFYSEDYYGTADVVGPIYFTIDMKEEKYLSRMKMWMRSRNSWEDYSYDGHRYYRQGALKYYEIWGTNNPRAINEIGDGSREANLAYWTEWEEVGGTDEWKNDWVKLGEEAALPPSGAINGDFITVDDKKYADEGFETEFDPAALDQKYRYLRIVVKETWGGIGRKIFIGEFRVWGQN
ncbi:DUF4959 domain-containing protein [Puteibacter caeruleilacunae]|nr:DUF4959 domain-containing protein [Puteibacter caeruleilacunae]